MYLDLDSSILFIWMMRANLPLIKVWNKHSKEVSIFLLTFNITLSLISWFLILTCWVLLSVRFEFSCFVVSNFILMFDSKWIKERCSLLEIESWIISFEYSVDVFNICFVILISSLNFNSLSDVIFVFNLAAFQF